MRTLLIAALAGISLALPLGAQPPLFHDHGHGLAFSPDGSALLAPTHDGMAVYRDGAWSEAPGPERGFSGFSVAERAIYSSAHSPHGAQVHKAFGLVKSTDGGRSWQRLVLAGEADFHLIAAGYRSNAIYVLNPRPNSLMPAPGLYVTLDEGRSWRRAAARGLEGEIHGLSAHPREAGAVAAATGRGLYLSRDGGETFARLDGRELATGVAFDPEGGRLRYAHALSNEVVESGLDGRRRKSLHLPPLGKDYVTCLAQHPKDERVLAFASRRRDVFVTRDGGLTWKRIARGDELEGTPEDE